MPTAVCPQSQGQSPLLWGLLSAHPTQGPSPLPQFCLNHSSPAAAGTCLGFCGSVKFFPTSGPWSNAVPST